LRCGAQSGETFNNVAASGVGWSCVVAEIVFWML